MIPAKTLDHLIAVAQRNPNQRVITRHRTWTLDQLQTLRPPTFPLPPCTTERAWEAHQAKHGKAAAKSLEQVVNEFLSNMIATHVQPRANRRL